MHVLIIFAIWVIAAIGWVLNIVSLVGCEIGLNAETILRAAGIFVAPLGAVLGFFPHF